MEPLDTKENISKNQLFPRISFNLQDFPTEILYSTYKSLPFGKRVDLLAKVPELHKYYEPKSHLVVVIVKPQDRPIPREFKNRYGTGVDPFIVNIDSDITGTKRNIESNMFNTGKFQQSFNHTMKSIQIRLSEIQEVTGIMPHLLIDFAFGLTDDNCYNAANLYQIIHRYVRDTPHTLNIYKSPQNIGKLSKSRTGAYGLFDAISSISLIKDESLQTKDIPLLNNIYVKLPTPFILMKTGKFIRISTLFNDILPQQLLPASREDILSVKSNLKGINIVTPTDVRLNNSKSTQYTDKFIYDHLDHGLKRDHIKWDIKIESTLLQKSIVQSFIDFNSEKSYRIWCDYLYHSRACAVDNNLKPFHDRIRTDCGVNFSPVTKLRDLDLTCLSNEEYKHSYNEAYHVLFADLKLNQHFNVVLKDLPGRNLCGGDSLERAHRRRIELHSFSCTLSKIIMLRKLYKMYENEIEEEQEHESFIRARFTEYNILGSHWLEPDITPKRDKAVGLESISLFMSGEQSEELLNQNEIIHKSNETFVKFHESVYNY
ncbi:hypothetical protein WICPIJ_009659 [Wickerhamomyces pijperi]|uniref:Uncharacterized protein n=1 Tax=Wickerhamomyces pijperi TaxID=599730 RepID=A0A9P8PLU3_WICPI|nr:hypothetical protein WICPIJ_009659 [Wickerhamomyces pijperi]